MQRRGAAVSGNPGNAETRLAIGILDVQLEIRKVVPSPIRRYQVATVSPEGTRVSW